MKSNYDRMFSMLFKDLYVLYLNKVERKSRSKEELDTVIKWLSGYSDEDLSNILSSGITVKEFFEGFIQLNEKAGLIKGMICGVRIEDIEDTLVKRVRMLDKLVDDISKGKSLDKVIYKDWVIINRKIAVINITAFIMI